MSSEELRSPFRPDEVEVQTIYVPPEGEDLFVKDDATCELAEKMGGSWWFSETGPFVDDHQVERTTGFFFNTMDEAQKFGVRAMLELGLRVSYPAPQPLVEAED